MLDAPAQMLTEMTVEDAARLDAEAEADFESGRFVPHDRVRTWLLKLSRGEWSLPPEA